MLLRCLHSGIHATHSAGFSSTHLPRLRGRQRLRRNSLTLLAQGGQCPSPSRSEFNGSESSAPGAPLGDLGVYALLNDGLKRFVDGGLTRVFQLFQLRQGMGGQ